MFSALGIRPRNPNESHRAATQLELFFDLVAVIGIAATTAAFHHAISEAHGLQYLPNFLFVFVGIWWAWMNHAWYSSAFDNDDPVHRVLTFVIMLGFPVFTAGAESILVREGLFNGVIGWTIMRFGMVGLWLRAAAASTGRLRRTALTYAVGITLTQSLWWVFFFIIPKYDATVFLATGLAIYLVEFAVPVVAERGSPTPWHRHHMIERYGLLTFIILGEVLLSVSMMLGTLYDGHAEPGLIGQRCRALSSWSASGGCISSPKTI